MLINNSSPFANEVPDTFKTNIIKDEKSFKTVSQFASYEHQYMLLFNYSFGLT